MTTDNRKVQIPVEVDATGAKAGFDQVKQGARDMAQAVEQAGAQASKGVDGIGAGAPAASQKVDAATRSMIGSIQRATAVMEAGGRANARYFETLAAQRGINVETLKPYLAQLDAVSSKQVVATSALHAGAAGLTAVGMSAKQTSMALRQVPMQFTDIVTSLAAGQRPLQVLLQQGGQLKDTFGGLGPAARALGGYVAGLVNPFTVAAGVVGVLAIAYNQGSKEADAYSKALIMTGNAAGSTASQLQGTARAVAAIVGTQSAAADAVAQLAGTGKVAAQNLQQFAAVAVAMERNAGVAVKETVKQFEELGRSPVEASLKLTERTNYLTAAVYEQIRAMAEQGRTVEAAALAQQTYAEAAGRMARDLENNLGSIETGWRALGDAAKWTWDQMLGIGRQQTVSDQLAEVQGRLAKSRQPFDASAFGGNAEARATQGEDREKERRLLRMMELQQGNAAAAAELVKTERAGLEWSQLAYENRSKQKKEEAEIARVRQIGLTAGRSELEIETQIAAVREKFKDKSAESAAKAATTQYTELLLRVRERVKLADEELAAGRQLTAAEKMEVSVVEMLASAKSKLNPVQEEAVRGALEEAKAREVLVAVQRGELAQAQALAKARQGARNRDDSQAAEALRDITQAQAASVTAARDQVRAMQDEARARDLSIRLHISLEEAVERVTIARLEEKRAMLVEGSESEERLRSEIALRKELAAGIGDREAFKKQVDGLREIDEVARDVFNDVSENGVNAFERIGKTIKSAVLDMIYKLTLRPILIQFAGGLTGASESAIAQAISGGSGGGGIGGMLSNANTAYSLYNGGAANYASQVGSWFGYGPAASGTFAGAGGTAAGADMSLFYSGSQMGTSGGAAAGAGAGVGTAAAGAAAIGVIALAAVKAWQSLQGEKRGGAEFAYTPGTGTQFVTGPDGGRPEGADELVTGLLDSTVVSLNEAFKSFDRTLRVNSLQGAWETSQTGRGGVFSGGILSDGSRFGESGKGSNYDYTGPNDSKFELWAGRIFGGAGPGAMPDMDGTPEELAADLQQSYIAAIQASVGIVPKFVKQQLDASAQSGTSSNFGEAAGGNNFMVGLEGFEKNPVPVYLRVFDEEMKARARDLGLLPKRILDLIIDIDPETLSAEATQALTTKISTMVANVNGFRAIVDALPIGKLRDASFEVASTIVQLQGGLEATARNMASFVDNFYSDEEKRRHVGAQIQKSLADAGLELSLEQILATSRDTFRGIIDTLAPDSPLYSALMSVNAQFASIAPAAELATESLAEMQARLADMGEGVWSFVRDLKTERGGTASAQQTLSGSRSAYLEDLALARQNDPDALNRINGSAQAYIEAQKGFSASGAPTQAVIDQIIAEMSALPAVKSYEQQMLEALRAINGSIGDLPTSLAVQIADQFGQIDIDASGGISFEEMKLALGDKATDAQLQAIFAELDVNGDGTISRLEAINASMGDLPATLAAQIADQFSQIDINASGGITFDELQQVMGGKATDAELKAIFGQLDANGDGTISRLEALMGQGGSQVAWLAALNQSVKTMGDQLLGAFDAIDLDITGMVDFTELKSYLGPLATDDSVRALIARADINGDKQLTSLELIAGAVYNAASSQITALSSKFDALDASVDGTLTFTELKAGLKLSDDVTRLLIARVDANGDGTISRLESIKAADVLNAQRIADATTNAANAQVLALSKKFDTLDLSVDGVLTYTELKAGLKLSDDVTRALIARVDANGDGNVSKLEAVRAGAITNAKSITDAEKVIWGESKAQQAALHNLLVNSLASNFASLDTDLSGALDNSEIADYLKISNQKAAQLIAIVDADGNGTLSKLEVLNASVKAAGTTVSNTTKNEVGDKLTTSNTKLASINAAIGPMAAGITGSYPASWGYADGGDHPGGWRLVGERGPELEYTGPAHIFSHQDSLRMLTGASNDPGLRQEMTAQRQVLERVLAVLADGQGRSIDELRQIKRNTESDASSLLRQTAVTA